MQPDSSKGEKEGARVHRGWGERREGVNEGGGGGDK